MLRPDNDRGRPAGAASSISTTAIKTGSTVHPTGDTFRGPRRIAVRFVNASCAFVTGYGSRELITELRGRPPVWSTLSRAWSVQPQTARDLIAVAESRGYDVTIHDGDPGGGRW